jgi:hypothetical protein
MYHHHDCYMPPHPHPYQPGLMGVFGGVINLTTAALYGGARIVRTVVEGSVWHGEYPPHHDCCGCHHHHVCHVHCCPETHNCCGCC